MIRRAINMLPSVFAAAVCGAAPCAGFAASMEAPGMGSAPQAWQQVGEASFYSSHYDGRRTSSGTRYDPDKLTAAHPDLPLGTRLEVINAETGRAVVVTVTDRQAENGRVIDLSRRAAEEIGMIGRGTARVRLIALSADAPAAHGGCDRHGGGDAPWHAPCRSIAARGGAAACAASCRRWTSACRSGLRAIADTAPPGATTPGLAAAPAGAFSVT